ncbi:MAG TPA: FAD-binding oxidoreductase [Chloroflexota bacterium]|nr:FAD-binding oxidoreductase [Chloroflexota bacterium]
MQSLDVVVIGGGNLGLWTAYHLARRGAGSIAVCERHWCGFGATTRSAGMMRQQGGTETAIKLGKWSRDLYLQLGAELGLDSGFVQTGYYVLATSPRERDAFKDLVALRRACGVENEWVDPDEGRRRCPWITWDGLYGATYTAGDGYVHPPIVARNITLAVARCDGVSVYERCPVTAIERHGSRFRVQTPRGGIEAERVVNAGGPRGARALGAMLDVEVPVSAMRHHIAVYATIGEQMPRGFPMAVVLSQGYYVRPEEQGALLGLSSAGEQADHSELFQMEFDWPAFEAVRPHWEHLFPALRGLRIARAWTGAVDYTPDHLPIIDQPLPGYFVLAAGGHGMMWGPALGLKMAELMADGRVGDLPDSEVRLGRFADGRTVHDPIALPFPTS